MWTACNKGSNGCFALHIWSWFQVDGIFFQVFETRVNLEVEDSGRKEATSYILFSSAGNCEHVSFGLYRIWNYDLLIPNHM